MLRHLSLNKETIIAMAALALAWQLASMLFPPFLFPPVPAIAEQFFNIFRSESLLLNAVATLARILGGLVGAFALGTMLALVMAKWEKAHRHLYPVLHFNQGIPALSWVVISIIWFRNTEFRIWFIMVATTLPAFTFQILDAYRSISKDLLEMSLSFRPSRYDLFRTLILPTVVPGILTAWKVNLGNASRVVVVAELVGATSGIGYQLLLMQQLFNMAGALAWTLMLVLFVLVVQRLITLIEDHVLTYRAAAERGI